MAIVTNAGREYLAERVRALREDHPAIFFGWSEDWGYPRPTRDPLASALHVSPYRGGR